MTKLKDQVIWVTGASSGIGEALAIQASSAGAYVILTARRKHELERVRSLCAYPKKVAVLPLDLTAFDAEAAASAAAEPFGAVDILVNNAGWSQRSALVDTQMPVYRKLMELDFFAPVALTRAVMPSMLERKAGHVVMISSVAGKIGVPNRTGYSAAKHALAGFTEAARAELWRDGVRFTVVYPGYVRTPISANALEGDGSQHHVMDATTAAGMSPEGCAEEIWDSVIANDEEAFVGSRALAYVRLKRYAPRLFSFALKRVARDGG